MLRHMLVFAHAFCSCICYFSAFLPQFCFFFSWVNMLSAVNGYRYSSTRPGTHCFTVVFTISIGAPHLHVRAVTDDIDINIRHPTVAFYTYVLLDAVVCTSVQLCPAGCWSRRRCCAAVCLCVVVCCCCNCGAVRISYLFLAPYFCILHLLSFRIQR